MDLVKLNLDSAIAVGRMAMRIERDQRDWLEQAIEKGRREIRCELWKAYAEFIRERRAA